MAFNPNQKHITVHKAKCDRNNLYTQFNLQAFDTARRTLNPNAFILWTYIAQNQNGYTFGLSPEDVSQHTMMKKTAYNNAVKELIDKGYLTLTREQNVYDFSETLVEETQPDIRNPQYCDNTTKVIPQYCGNTTAQYCDNTTKVIPQYCGNTRNIKREDITIYNNTDQDITPPPHLEVISSTPRLF